MATTEEGYTYNEQTLLITDPGKFQGLPRWAPYFWECYLNGDGVTAGDDVMLSTFDITPGELAGFPELAGAAQVTLWEDDQGFVHVGKVMA